MLVSILLDGKGVSADPNFEHRVLPVLIVGEAADGNRYHHNNENPIGVHGAAGPLIKLHQKARRTSGESAPQGRSLGCHK
jgi:hypothetical protein